MNKDYYKGRYEHLDRTLRSLYGLYGSRISAYESIENFNDTVALNYIQDRSIYQELDHLVNILNEIQDYVDFMGDKEDE